MGQFNFRCILWTGDSYEKLHFQPILMVGIELPWVTICTNTKWSSRSIVADFSAAKYSALTTYVTGTFFGSRKRY